MAPACDAARVAMRCMAVCYGENTTQRRFRPETAVFPLVGTAVSRARDRAAVTRKPPSRREKRWRAASLSLSLDNQ
jgi:hypothetical protein